jgi:hypothetical protein
MGVFSLQRPFEISGFDSAGENGAIDEPGLCENLNLERPNYIFNHRF